MDAFFDELRGELSEMSEQHLREMAEAEVHLTKAAIVVAKNDRMACVIKVGGVKISSCHNASVVAALTAHLDEIEKFLAGKENLYE